MAKMNPVYQGEGEFVFENGDVYQGEYTAHRKGLVWREGKGLYLTHDGQFYEGIWKNDKLDEVNPLHIVFQNLDTYEGKVSKYKYNGPGSYRFRNGGRLTCSFEKNKPSSDVIFIDHHDQLWYGKAEENHVALLQEHVFSAELDSERGKGKPKFPSLEPREHEEIMPDEIWEEEPDDRVVEKTVFAKSTLIPSEINFEESQWLKEYRDNTKRMRRILSKVRSSGVNALTSEEAELYKERKQSSAAVDRFKRQPPPMSPPSLWKEYLDQQALCPAMAVFYPRYFGDFGE